MAITQIAKGRSWLKKFVISELTGEVLSQEKSSQTEVTGKITGGGTNSVYGTVAPVQGKIESTTTDFQTLYLQDDDDVERVVELVDLTVPCRPGHKLTVWRLGEQLWIRAFNHNTQESYTYGGLSKLMFPKIFYFIFGTLFASWVMGSATTSGLEYAMFWFVYWLVGLALGVIPSKIIASLRVRAIRKAIEKNAAAAIFP